MGAKDKTLAKVLKKLEKVLPSGLSDEALIATREGMSPSQRKEYFALLNKLGTKNKRAAAMGFDVKNPQFHGTGADIKQFQVSSRGTYGPGIYTTLNPKEASVYAAKSEESPNVLPLLTKSKSQYFSADTGDILKVPGADEVNKYDLLYDHNTRAKFLKEKGFLGITETKGRDHYRNTFDPKDIRSQFAAFDPRYKDSRYLLAGMGVVPGANELKETLSDIGQTYGQAKENILGPVADKFAQRTDFTPQGNENFRQLAREIIMTGGDPINYVPGGAGVVAGIGLGVGESIADQKVLIKRRRIK